MVPPLWKLNSSLLDDKEYVSLINMKYPLWNDEFKDVTDPRLFWDLMKYRIGQFRIVQQQKNRVEVEGNNLHFPLF